MKLLTDALRKQFPPLYATETIPLLEKQVITCFFMVWGEWLWYPCEFDGTDLFFGLVVGYEAELGYFRLSELETAVDSLGEPAVAREQRFTPKPLRDAIIEAKRKRPDVLWHLG